MKRTLLLSDSFLFCHPYQLFAGICMFSTVSHMKEKCKGSPPVDTLLGTRLVVGHHGLASVIIFFSFTVRTVWLHVTYPDYLYLAE